MEQPIDNQQAAQPITFNESPVIDETKQDRRMSDEWG